MESRIEELRRFVNALLSSPVNRFTVSDVPSAPSIYVISDAGGSILYVGRTINLRRRILGDHRSGNIRGSAFRKALSEEKRFENEEEISNFIRTECTFQFRLVDEDLSAVEHFAIAVLNPLLNK